MIRDFSQSKQHLLGGFNHIEKTNISEWEG
jgi:hypothetical protein